MSDDEEVRKAWRLMEEAGHLDEDTKAMLKSYRDLCEDLDRFRATYPQPSPGMRKVIVSMETRISGLERRLCPRVAQALRDDPRSVAKIARSLGENTKSSSLLRRNLARFLGGVAILTLVFGAFEAAEAMSDPENPKKLTADLLDRLKTHKPHNPADLEVSLWEWVKNFQKLGGPFAAMSGFIDEAWARLLATLAGDWFDNLSPEARAAVIEQIERMIARAGNESGFRDLEKLGDEYASLADDQMKAATALLDPPKIDVKPLKHGHSIVDVIDSTHG